MINTSIDLLDELHDVCMMCKLCTLLRCMSRTLSTTKEMQTEAKAMGTLDYDDYACLQYDYIITPLPFTNLKPLLRYTVIVIALTFKDKTRDLGRY